MAAETVHTLVIGETEPIVVAGLRNVLGSCQEFRIVSTADSLPETMEAASQFEPAILLLDKAFGFQALLNGLQTLRRSAHPPSVVIWGTSLNEPESLRFVQQGASATVRKTASLEMLLECLRTVAAGNTWIEHQPRRDQGSMRSPRSALTPRESQVMDLVEQGLKNRDIATFLGISVGTVKIHLKHIFEKTGIRGRYGLALSGLKEKGLLSLPEPEIP